MGDYWSVTLHPVKNGGSYKPDSIYHGKFVRTAATLTVPYAAATYEIKTEFRLHSVPAVATAFTDLTASKLQGTNNAQTVTPAPFANAEFTTPFLPFGLTAAAEVGTVATPGTL